MQEQKMQKGMSQTNEEKKRKRGDPTETRRSYNEENRRREFLRKYFKWRPTKWKREKKATRGAGNKEYEKSRKKVISYRIMGNVVDKRNEKWLKIKAFFLLQTNVCVRVVFLYFLSILAVIVFIDYNLFNTTSRCNSSPKRFHCPLLPFSFLPSSFSRRNVSCVYINCLYLHVIAIPRHY